MLPMKNKDIDYNHAFQLTDHIYWVGHFLENDEFQCHVYLIENGEESVLLDPGSKLTFQQTLRKIEEIIPFSHIKYFICHHQDPDITGALPLIDQMVSRSDAVIVSHWRAIALLKHYGLKLPFICVEKEGWTLPGSSLDLEFLLTPYLHFPGAYCTFHKDSGILFSSDLFGGYTQGWSLVAESEDYFDSIKMFHEHYMPSNEILRHSLAKIEKLPLKLIAPQHGSIIPDHLISFIISQLKELDCGLYLLSQTSTAIERLMAMNHTLNSFHNSIIFHRNFNEIAQTFTRQMQKLFPVESLYFYAIDEHQNVVYLSPDSMFQGVHREAPSYLAGYLGEPSSRWSEEFGKKCYWIRTNLEREGRKELILPLVTPETLRMNSFAILLLEDGMDIDKDSEGFFLHISKPLGVAVEREILHLAIDEQKNRLYQLAIRDNLTGLYTRDYMKEAVLRLFNMQDRKVYSLISLIIFDIDHFKRINDTYGHNYGDDVLKTVAGVLIESSRQGDIQIRLGGEEFAVFLVVKNKNEAFLLAERIRKKVELLVFSSPMESETITISGGVAHRRESEDIRSFIERADKALYEAKSNGRNQIKRALP